MATTHMMNTVKEMSRRTGGASSTALLEIYKVQLKLVKQWPGKEKDLLPPMRELYAKTRERTDWDKIPAEEVLKFCAQEVAKQKVATSVRKKMANAIGRPAASSQFASGGGFTTNPHQQPQPAPQQMTAFMEVKQQRAQILAYVAKMERFTADLAISSVSQLPANVVAGMIGLNWADQPRELVALQGKLAGLKPSQLAQAGLSSSELLHILSFARHFNMDLVHINTLVANQKKYESDFTKKFLAASRASTFVGLPPVKQTVPFKAKHDASPHMARKSLQNVVKKVLPTKGHSPAESSLAKFNQMLGSSGVTVTKPGGPSTGPDTQPSATSASASSSSGAQTLVQSMDMSKKFPHLTISSVDPSKVAAATTFNSSSSATETRAVPVAVATTSAAPTVGGRPIYIKSFASLHADSTNISGGDRSPAGKSNAAATPPPETNSARPVVMGSGRAGGFPGSNGPKSSMSVKPVAGAGARKMSMATGMGRPPGAGNKKTNEVKLGQGKSIVALRDFKAQVKYFYIIYLLF